MMKRLRICCTDRRGLVYVACLLQITDYVLGASVAQEQDQSYSNSVDSISRTIVEGDPNSELYGNLIDILDRLNIVRGGSGYTSCVSLERVTRDVTAINRLEKTRTIGVYLVFKETFQHADDIPRPGADITYRDATSQALNDKVAKPPNNTEPKPLPDCNKTSGISGVAGLDRLSMKKERGNATSKPGPADGKSTNSTATVQIQEGGETESNMYGGLSRTQVVVIATCSAVIGTFFLIAAGMRIRNYVKRLRDNRNGRRSSSMGLQGSNYSSGILRRDSSSSKASRQSHTAIAGGGDISITSNNSQSSLHKPSSPAHRADPSVRLPVCPLLKQEPHTDTGLGAQSYWTEESRDRTKTDVVLIDEDDDTEDDPLLRKSPDSGSSVEMDDDRRDSEQLSSRSPEGGSTTGSLVLAVPATPETDDITEDVGLNSQDTEDSPPSVEIASRDTTANVPPEPEVRSVSLSGLDDALLAFNGNLDFDLDEHNVHLPRNRNDAYAVDIGLNQSDNSLSYTPSYCYGNQSEYVSNYCYGNVPYSCPTVYVVLPDNFPTTDYSEPFGGITNGNHDKMTYSNGTDTDNEYSDGGEYQGLSPMDIPSDGLSNDSSGEPLLSENISEGKATYFGDESISGTDNHALLESGDDASPTGGFSTNSPVKSQVRSVSGNQTS